MDISITMEAMWGLNWPLWGRLIEQVERVGFDGLYRSDHFMIAKPGSDSLELITSLTYLATHSQKLHFGSMVAPLSFHHPSLLARQAMSINDLSGGRMILGVGAGWHEEEHDMFGFTLGDKKTRLDRFAEGLQVMHALIHEKGPVNFAGKYFTVREAQLVPQSPVRMMVGGNGPTRTLPLVARYADVWNCQLADAAAFKEVNARLDEMICAAGRQPQDVKRTVMIPALCVRTEQDLERHLNLLAQHSPPLGEQTHEQLKDWLYGLKGIIGTPQQVVDGIAAFRENGAQEIVIEWFSLHDAEGIELLGSEVLPHLR